MEYFFDTDIGKIRKNNEDYIYYDSKTNIFVLADGMGGHNAGEIASQKASEYLFEYLHAKGDITIDENILKEAVIFSNNKLLKTSKESVEFTGMGTTFTCAMIRENEAIIAHIGDTRAYKIDEESIVQITEDHTVSHQLYKQGKISKKELKVHKSKHILIKALGTLENLAPDMYSESFEKGAYLLICSDGLTDQIGDKKIFTFVNENKKPKEIVEKLISKANDCGGIDNVSIICIKFENEKELK